MTLQKLERQKKMLHHLSTLPRLMTNIYGRENASEFLLHELCSKSCFDLRKAAYFVDNPDFNCIQGIVGYDADKLSAISDDIWLDPEIFSSLMSSSEFNKLVRSISSNSVGVHKEPNAHDTIERIAQQLGGGDFEHCLLKLRHDNHGLLMYQKNDPQDDSINDHIVDGMSLLSFCPIF